MIVPSPKLIALGAAALVVLGLTSWALLERSGRMGCKADLAAATAQIATLIGTIDRQSAAVLENKAAGDRAVANTRALLAEAQRLAQPRVDQAQASEKAATAPAPAGKGCDAAWEEIEKGRAS